MGAVLETLDPSLALDVAAVEDVEVLVEVEPHLDLVGALCTTGN